MRAGEISDAMWDVYMSRVIQEDDARLTAPASPFVASGVQLIVHRHNIRVMRSLAYAKEQSRRLAVPLYSVQALSLIHI